MSQIPPSYPPSYPPQPPYPMQYALPEEHQLSARRAGALMYVMAALALLGAFCCAGIGFALPQLMAERPEIFSEARTLPDMTPAMLRAVFIGLGIVELVGAIVLVVLGALVRRGNKPAIIISMVIAILAVLYFLFSLASVLIGGRIHGGSALGGALCSTVVPLALFGLLLAWLIGALKSGGSTQALQQQYAQQYWQQMWQQQMYNQTPPGPAANPNPPPSENSPPPPQ